NNNKDALVDGKEHDDDIQKSVSPDIHSLSCGDQTRIQGDKAENKDKGKSPVVTITGFTDLNEEFEECISNRSNGVNAAGFSVSAAGLNFTNSTNDFSVASPSNASMPNLEDLSHNGDNVGAETDINNMESIISVSHIPTIRIHKDHPTSQIIGDLSSTTQTKSMARAVRDQGGISQMFNEDFHTWQMATGKESSNPFMAGSLPKTILYSFLHKICFHFWNIAVVKRSGVIYLPNEEIFAGLTRMGYEKPSTKLTFYKAFFSTQWKFFIHTILHSLSAKRTSWNEFSSAMASALICLSSGQRFNFSKYIFESLVRNVDSSSKFYMYPHFIQLIIQTNIADLSKHTNRYISPVLTQKVFANMRRVGKGFSGVETPLFESMLAVRVVAEEVEVQVPAHGDNVHEHDAEEVATDVVPPTPTSPSPSSPVIPSLPPHQSPCLPQPQDAEGLENANATQQLEIVKLKARMKKLEKLNKVKSSKLRRLRKVGTSQRVESS
nr:hypothetical protein [Tanacetum cinerariifolium]